MSPYRLALWLTGGETDAWDVAHEERPLTFIRGQIVACVFMAVVCVILPLGPGRFPAAAAMLAFAAVLRWARSRLPDAHFDGALSWIAVFGALVASGCLPLLLPAATIVIMGNIAGGAQAMGRRTYILLAVGVVGVSAIGLTSGTSPWWLLVLTMMAVAPWRVEHAVWAAEREEVQRRRVELLTETGGALRWEADLTERRLLTVLGEVEKRLGWTSEDLIDHVNVIAAQKSDYFDALKAGRGEWLVELPHGDGSKRWFKLSSGIRQRADGHTIAFGVAIDVHEFEMARREERLRAQRDSLTGLANRDGLADFLDGEAGRVGRAVLMLDLDRFKDVNDTLGHLIGDRLIAAAADRLARYGGEDRCVARIGGDEFAIAIVGDESVAVDRAVEQIVHDVCEDLSGPFALDEIEVYTSASMGIASGADLDWAELLRRADVAMYEAKRGGVGHLWFSESGDPDGDELISLRARLNRSLEDEIAVWFQPVVSADRHHLVGVECLARWQHPDAGIISPGVFLPIVDFAGLTGRLDQHVLAAAVEAASSLAAATDAPVSVSVNLSPRSLWSPTLLGFLDDLLRRHPLAAGRLTVEITEQGLLEDHERIRPTLLAMRELGIEIALDDFGTGASSLIRLRSLPFNVIKIDRSFVGGLPGDRTDAAIVKSTVELARELGMSTTAEGVETAEQAKLLARFGCDKLQGYLFDPAVTMDELVDRWLPVTAPTGA